MARYKNSNKGRLRGCGGGRITGDANADCCCGYIDTIQSLQNRRVRHFDKCAKVLWVGSGRNYAGQHPERDLDCGLAVYDVDFNADTLKLYRRDSVSGADGSLQWEQPLGFFTDLAKPWNVIDPPMAPWSRHSVVAYQSHNDRVVLSGSHGSLAAHYNLIQVRDFMTGAILSESYVTELDLSAHALNPTDIVALSDTSLLFWNIEPDSPGVTDFTVYGGTVAGSTLTLDQDCSSLPNVTRTDASARASFARQEGSLYTSALDEGTEILRTVEGKGSSVAWCDFLKHDGDLTYGRRHTFSSSYCGRIYHLGSPAAINKELVRYTPGAADYDVLPIEPFWIGSDWLHVVRDTHRLADGSDPEASCIPTESCGGDGDDPDCCNNGEAITIELAIGAEGEFICSTIPINNGAFITFNINATLDPQLGCPGDCLANVTAIITPGQPSGIILPAPCDDTLVEIDCHNMQRSITYYLPGGIPADGCIDVEATASTDEGCSKTVFFKYSTGVTTCV